MDAAGHGVGPFLAYPHGWKMFAPTECGKLPCLSLSVMI
ncbi:hypothetical protein BRO54_0363 [Geobacillus proteiniphilus]|uniref:Uncharacterized protein n=1 Tax=Geobacillus proteiniphilus TaxID=860353 RepID=A0A1Q5T9C5_9BACL|nr:hypothetical protein BRO54_0363 [Geobacillus proteiniphilus]